MACTSPSQSVMASPTTSSSSHGSRLSFMSGDRSDDASDVGEHERVETGTDAMLDHVRQLIVDLFVVDDNRRGSSVCLNEDIVVEPIASLLCTRDAKDLSTNLEVKEDGDSSARERLLETKLARVLMELAGEQDNLRLAANAGNALLEELGAAREELDVVHDELKAAQIERDQAVRDSQRLRDQNAALETEMQRYNAVYDFWDSAGRQNMLSTQQQRRSSLTSRESFGRPDSCKWCSSREVEVTQLDQCIDELRRRCLELELAREREQQQQRELAEEITQLQQQNKEQSLELVRAQQDLEFMTLQLEQQVEEVESVQAVRDTLHRTARRLKAENEGLQARLVARDELVEKLENDKARTATQLQVAENRTMSAQAVTKRITKTLRQLQKQLEHALQQQQVGRDSNEAEVEPCERESEDIEQLLQDARREDEVLRLENRVLRRQRSSEASPNGSRMRGRRRKMLCAGGPAMTAADVLALGSQESSRAETASYNSNSESGSDVEPTTSSNFQLVKTIAPSTNASELLSKDGKERRILSSKLSWVDQPSMTIDDTATAFKEDIRSACDLREGGHRTMVVDENQVGCALHQEITASSSVHAALSRLSHVNNNLNNPHVHVSWGDRKKATRLSAIGYTGCPRIRELPIEVFGRDAIELPPTSPLYLGLSFIACATAATAANFLVRR
ncbi:unnamed protein product [Peronospora effusa]|nr:unnamed protein product [Peronospora effusa]